MNTENPAHDKIQAEDPVNENPNVVDFKKYRQRDDVFHRRIDRMHKRMPPEAQAKLPAFYDEIGRMLENDPRARAILGENDPDSGPAGFPQPPESD